MTAWIHREGDALVANLSPAGVREIQAMRAANSDDRQVWAVTLAAMTAGTPCRLRAAPDALTVPETLSLTGLAEHEAARLVDRGCWRETLAPRGLGAAFVTGDVLAWLAETREHTQRAERAWTGSL